MKIFDSHAHIYPDKIAERASAGIGEFYDMPVKFDGTASDLLARLDSVNAAGALICSVATVPEQVCTINDFMAQSIRDCARFAALAALHPDMTQNDVDAEIERTIGLGLRGIKLHPDFQKFDADGAKAFALFEVIGSRLPVLLHAGDTRFGYSTPRRIAAALRRFPQVRVIAAHLGGWSEWDDAQTHLAGKFDNLYVDSCSSFYEMSPQKARECITAFGAERVLFGSDYPMWDIRDELEMLDKLGLDDDSRRKILCENALRVFNITLAG